MMKIRLSLAFLLLTICPAFVRAQKTVTHDRQTWFGVFSQIRLFYFHNFDFREDKAGH